MSTGRELHSLSTHALKSIGLSADGKLALVGDHETAVLLDADRGRSIRSFAGVGSQVADARLVASDHKAVVAYRNGVIALYDVETGDELFRCPQKIRSRGLVQFSPDGRLLAVQKDVSCEVYSTVSGELKLTADGHSMAPPKCVFSPDGKLLATAGATGRLLLWNVESGQRVGVLQSHKSSINAVVFSADGELLVTGSTDRTCRVFDVQTMTELMVIGGHGAPVVEVAISPDSSLVASSSEALVRLWRIDNRRVLSETIKRQLREDKVASLGDIAALDAVTIYGHRHTRPPFFVAFSPDGKLVATAAIGDGQGDEQVKVWTTAGRQEKAGFPVPAETLLHTAWPSAPTAAIWRSPRVERGLP